MTTKEVTIYLKRQTLPPPIYKESKPKVIKAVEYVNKDILQIYKEPVSSEIIKEGKISLSKKLESVSNFSNVYSVDSEYINIVVNKVAETSKNVEEFAAQLANIIVFLDDIMLKSTGAKIFMRRIQNEYYLPDVLAELSPVEKLPEVFSNDDITENDKKNIFWYN